jgi:hypothetical protein
MDYTTCLLTRKYITNDTSISTTRDKLNKNITISQNFFLTNNISIIDNNQYYRINLHHNNDFIIPHFQTEILNNIDNHIYLYIPILSLIHDLIDFGYDTNLFIKLNNIIGYSNLNIDITIHDKIGIFNIIDKYKNNI